LASIHLSGPRHVYDVRAGQYMGELTDIRFRFPADTMARIFAALPYRVERVRLAAVGTGPAGGGEAARFSASVLPAAADGETHTLRIRVFDPSGGERRTYACSVTTRAGRAEFGVPVALNDPTGDWRVTATDVASGVVGESAFTVAAR
jgi:hypothetical protein